MGKRTVSCFGKNVEMLIYTEYHKMTWFYLQTCHSQKRNYILKESCSRKKAFAWKEQDGTGPSVSIRNQICFIEIKCMRIYMPKNTFFIWNIGLLSVVLLYNFTITQYIEGRASRKKPNVFEVILFFLQ